MKVLILGLGQYANGSGVLVCLYFVKRGDDVTVADFYYTPAMDANVKQLKKFKNVKFILGKHATQEVKKADVIVKHQRLRMTEPEVVEAMRLGKPLESELSVFFRECSAQIIGVTGTRGKSTTTALIAELLKGTKRKVWLGGNILLSPLSFVSKIKKDDLVVLEMSSFQLEGTGLRGVSPQIAVWTNLMRDHLNAYPSMAEYAEAKAQIFRNQKPEDIVFLNRDKTFDVYAEEASGRVYRFGKPNSPEAKIVRGTRMRLLGEHNLRNAETAVAVALSLNVPISFIRKTLASFAGLPNRLEVISVKKGVRYINDTTATTPDATMVAVQALKSTLKKEKRIHLIFGGADKELEFGDVAIFLKKQPISIYLLPGTAQEKILAAFNKQRIVFQPVKDLTRAMQEIRLAVQTGDVVLLSPGCASFGLFQNEYDRGKKFKAFVRRLR